MNSNISSLFYLSEDDKSNAVKNIIDASSPCTDFFFMLVVSGMLATIGLLINNITVVIGSMLVTPLLAPILSLALGISMSDGELIKRSIIVLGKSMILVLVLNTFVAFILLPYNNLQPEVIRNFTPHIAYFYVAILSGLAGVVAFVKPKLSAALPGVAIAVALVPPLAAISIGIAKINYQIFAGAFQVFLINLTGIIFISLLVFSMMGFYSKRKVAHKEIIDENNKLNESSKSI